MSLETDPKVFGPGMWFSIHISGWNAKTPDDKKYFIKQTENLISNIQCLSCKSHGLEYLEKNPIMDYWDQQYKGEDIGMFKWTFNFHNAVNARLGKPLLSWETAYNLYSRAPATYCTATCGSDKHEDKHEDNSSSGVTFKNIDNNFPINRALISSLPSISSLQNRLRPPVTFVN